MNRGAVAEISLSALQHNFSKIQTLANGRSILAMVKSDAYGHGLLRISQALSLSHPKLGFGVFSLEDGITLRQSGINNPIVVLPGFYTAAEISLFAVNRLTPVIHQLSQITYLEQTPLNNELSIWLKVDTGMHRLGLLPEEFLPACDRLRAIHYIKKDWVVMSHLACADEPKKNITERQIALFSKLTDRLSSPKSLVNSAGLMHYPQALFDWIRPGIMLYGASPFAGRTGLDESLKPVMTVTAPVIALRQVRAGETVGYGGDWLATSDRLIATVAIGYGDGYPRHAPSGTPTFLNGAFAPLVGRVSMDMITIDVTEMPNVELGDRVTLWGEHLPIEKIAAAAGTISYELLCGLKKRIPMIEVK